MEENKDEFIVSNETEKKSNTGKKIIKVIFSLFCISVLLIILGLVAMDYVILDKNENINLVINNKNVTGNLKEDIIVEDEVIYISIQDMANFFDQNILKEEEIGKVVTTYRNQIAEVDLVGSQIDVNGQVRQMTSGIINQDEVIYIPISEMLDVYEIEATYLENTKVVTIDSTNRELIKATVVKNDAVKSSTNFIAKTYDRIEKGEEVVIVSEGEAKTQIRSTDGKIGYVNSSSLDNALMVRQDAVQTAQIDENINLTWDYFSEYASAPDRAEKIPGVNVVSPAFFHVDTDGNIVENVGVAGINYVTQSHNNGYMVWPMVSNAGTGMFSATSELVNSYEKRKNLIDQIVNAVKTYNLDGINMDFEYMKEEDVDMYSRLIIELSPRLGELDAVLSVDVTAPDGSPEWSLCYNRNTIASVADYIVFMAYDQYGSSSTQARSYSGI